MRFLSGLVLSWMIIEGALAQAAPHVSSEVAPKGDAQPRAYSNDLPIAERPPTLPKGFWLLGLLAGTEFESTRGPSSFALMSSYPLNDRLQVSGTFNNYRQANDLYQQSTDLTALYQVLRASPWGAMVSASWLQGIYPETSRSSALALAGTLTYQLKEGPWYLFTTQLLRYHFTDQQENVQATTSMLGGRQMSNAFWLNAGWTLLEKSSNAEVTKTIFDPQPLYLNFVWAVNGATDLTGSLGSTALPVGQNGVSLLLGINVRTPV